MNHYLQQFKHKRQAPIPGLKAGACGAPKWGHGYDDSFYHEKVIPRMECEKCGKTASDNYRALTTKYPDAAII